MPEFPRGWTINAWSNSPVLCAAQVSPMAGVTRVLDSIYAKVVNYGNASGSLWFVETFIGAASGPTLVLQNMLAVNPYVGGPPTEFTQDALSLSGLDLASQSGQGLSVQMNAANPASYWAEITIQGHDI